MRPLQLIARLLLIMAIPLLAACGTETTEITENLILRKSSIAEGTTVDALTTRLLTLEYNRVVKVAPDARITLNGAPLTAAVSAATGMNVELPLALEEGKDFELSVPSGSIAEAANPHNTAPALTLRFTTSAAPRLCDPEANASARALYEQLHECYGRTMISGIMCDVAWNHTNADQVQRWTGKRPVVNGYDYLHLAWSPANWIDYSDITPVTSWTADGGIAACMYHFNVPKTEADFSRPDRMTARPEETTFVPANCFVEGTWEKRFYDQQIDRLAEHLLLLQQAGVAVLWRPYHEAKGNTGLYNGQGKAWFWWGADGPDVFKHLWLDMYERFRAAGLHNLIWVFTDSTDNLSLDWYPGDAYVDIVGADVYNKTTAEACADVFRGLERAYPGKMIALSECGNVADIQSQWDAGARWLWFMPWYGGDATPHYTEAWWQQAAGADNVLMR